MKTIKKINEFRAKKRNELADLLDKIGANPTYVKLKNQGADELVEYGIKMGIKFAESQYGKSVPFDETAIEGFADKGGDILVGFWDKFWGIIKKILRRK